MLAVTPLLNLVAPVTVPPLNGKYNPAIDGKFKYVVADIVLAVTPLLNLVAPVTVPPLNGKYNPKVDDNPN